MWETQCACEPLERLTRALGLSIQVTMGISLAAIDLGFPRADDLVAFEIPVAEHLLISLKATDIGSGQAFSARDALRPELQLALTIMTHETINHSGRKGISFFDGAKHSAV